MNAQGQWQVFNTDNSVLPTNEVFALLGDGQGGLWVGTSKGLAHRNVQGEWALFKVTTNSYFLTDLNNVVTALSSDGQGGLWIGTLKEGLAHRNVQGEMVFTKDLGLPDNMVHTLLSDGKGGLWVGTFDSLGHYSAQGEWMMVNTENSNWPSDIKALLNDGQGGLWVGFRGGLAHRSAQGEWTAFNTEWPGGWVTSLSSDGQDGLWVGTAIAYGSKGGLAHRSAQGEWTVFNTENSGLPSNDVTTLLSDGQGGLWVGTYKGLAHRGVHGEWTVFNAENSGLPDGRLEALLSDGQGGLWVGTDGGGLAHYSAQRQWEVFSPDNSSLPSYYVRALLSDSQGGLWVGTSGGLAHYTTSGQWQVFNTDNSALPDNRVLALLGDSQSGLWVGTDGGLAHLTFTQKTALCQTTDATTCENLQATKRAAILIAGGGADSSNTLWDTTESITNYLYKVFNKRGFDNDEIYYLSPKAWADFNGDGLDDRIVDAPKPERPLTPEDVRLALEWAKGLGKLDQPLYLFFVDHGGTEKFQLSKMEYLEVTTLKTWLDDYQTVTGNQVMMVIDACHSGQLLDSLKAPNRAIISSTGDGLAYFERTDKRGFSRFFATGLLKGMNFWEAFGYAGDEQVKLLGDVSKMETASTGKTQEIGQVPRFYDGYDGSDAGKWLKQIYLNGSFTAGDLTLAVESMTPSTALTVGTPLSLKAKAILAEGLIERVWAVIRPPKMNLVMDSNGTPILVLPRLALTPSKSEKEIWETTWQEAMYNGDYQVTFYAEDNQGTIASSDLPVVITVTGGIDPPPQALVQLGLEKMQYQFGERFTATLTEQLSWGYDLYAAVLLPDGQTFVTLKNTNEFAPLNEPKPWRARRIQTQPVTWIDMTLPDTLPTGQYCLFGILSPEGGDVFETLSQGLWVSETKCFEIL